MSETQETITREYGLRYDLVAHSVKDQDAIHACLDAGFEPFSVSNSMVAPKPSKLSLVGEEQAPKFEMDTVIWFKRGAKVPLMTDEEMKAAEQKTIDEAKLDQLVKDQAERDGAVE